MQIAAAPRMLSHVHGGTPESPTPVHPAWTSCSHTRAAHHQTLQPVQAPHVVVLPGPRYGTPVTPYPAAACQSSHRCLCRHPRVVACLDLIEVDNNSFASILELCPGGDLDSHLQEHQVTNESLQC